MTDDRPQDATPDPLPTVTDAFARTIAPGPEDVVREMDARADREGFPTVGPAVGAWLRLLARAVDAERIFEFGSGFGYSACWMAPALPPHGEIVLTEIDADELDDARKYLSRAGYADRATFEHGDAIDVVDDHDGPFDLVLIDCEKVRYAEAFAAVREEVPLGGIVAADNAMTGPMPFEEVRGLLDGEEVDAAPESRGIVEYLRTVRDDDAFETGLLPLGEGVAVSVRTA